jgi:hypothetical protein
MGENPGDGPPLRDPQKPADRHRTKVCGGKSRLASSHATTSQICPSDIAFRHDGIPVILIPFLAIQNSSRGRHFWVASTRYGGGGSIPLTQR